MLHVLQHYLPLRKAILIASELVLLTLVVGAVMTAHLWSGPVERDVARLFVEAGYNAEEAFLRCLFSSFVAVVLAQLALGFNELYDFRVSVSRYDRARRFMGSMGTALFVTLGTLGLAHIWRLGPALDLPGLSLSQKVQVIVFGVLIGFSLLYLWRPLFHTLLRRADFQERVLILGSSKAAHVLAREMREHAASGYEIVGILPETIDPASGLTPYDPELTGTSDLVVEGLRLGEPGLTDEAGSPSSRKLEELVHEREIQEVVVALADRRGKLPISSLLHCRLAGIRVRNYDSVFENVTGKISVEALRPSYLIFNEGFSRHPWADLVKGLFDRAMALLMLALLWPVMLATAVAVRLSSPGPVLFTQERVGRDGQPFTLIKFRSMYADAEKRTGPVWATEDDPRITPIGRFLRKSRLDELPQLINVLSGSMSLVGPRPEREVFVEELSSEIPYFRQRQIVKPGLTGWAQINYPYGNTVEDALQKLQYDLFYIKYQSFLFDLSILFNTIKTIVLRRGT